MNKFLSRFIASVAMVVFGLGTSLFIPLSAVAKDGSDDQSSSTSTTSSDSGSSGDSSSTSKDSSSSDQSKTSTSGEHQKSNEDKQTSDSKTSQSEQEIEIEHQQSNEDGVHQELADDQKTINGIAIPEIHSTEIRSFDDATKKVEGLQEAITKIQDNLNLSATSTPLSTAEVTLLNQLARKHQGDTDAVKARLASLNSQLKDLDDILKPLAGQPIPNQEGLRPLLIKTIDNFRDQIKSLSDLAKLNVQLVDTETK